MSPVWRAWLLGWLALIPLAIGNGIARDLLYKDRLGSLRAHQLSTATLLALMTACVRVLDARWPIPTGRASAGIGAAWLTFTCLFEFGFGHFVARQPWSTLLEQYNLRRGYVWVTVPLWAGCAPAALRALRVRTPGRDCSPYPRRTAVPGYRR